MLGLNIFRDAKSASDYYTSNLSHEGEYFLQKQVHATWLGKLGLRLGIDGEQVTKESFSSFGKGVDYKTGNSLRVRQVSHAKSYYDLTFSAPKSVSVLFALTKSDEIHECHRQAYLSALTDIETLAQSQHNSDTQRGWETTGELLIANFDHFLSRPCAVKQNDKTTYISDPQMHTHCLIPNFTYSHKKGRYQNLELGNIHRQIRLFEASYHSYLAYNLEQKGFKTRLTKDRFELVGLTREIIMRFSNRSKEIDQLAAKMGIKDNAKKSKLSIATRNTKAKAASEAAHYEHWKGRLSKNEFEALFSVQKLPRPERNELTPEEAIQRSIEHHSQTNATFKQSDILAYGLKISYGSLLPHELKTALEQRADIVKAEIETVPYLTTHEMILQENSLSLRINEGKGIFLPLKQDYRSQQSILNKQQKNAVRHLLNSKDFVTVIKGAAGVGKTSLMKEVKQAVELSSKKFFSIAPSSQAVSVLKSKSFEADTIAGFLKNKELQNQMAGQVLLVDEAGMCGTKITNQILKIGKDKGMRLLMSGDTAQHAPPAQHGDAMRYIIEKAKANTVSLNKIVRQQSKPYRSVIQSLANNRTSEGYKKLEKMGSIIEVADRDRRLDLIAQGYIDSLKAKKSCLVISPTHAESNEINDRIRSRQKQMKLIGQKDKEYNRLQTLSFSDDQKMDKANYEPSMVLRFFSNTKGGYRAGNHYEVIAGNQPDQLKLKDLASGKLMDLPLEQAQKFEVYKQSKIQLAKADHIRLTINAKTREGSKISNGTSHQIEGFKRNGDIKLSNGKTLPKDIGHIRYSMCDTSHSSQGKDADHVIVSVSEHSFNVASQEQFYVSVSRGKYAAKIVTSEKSELKKAIIKSEQRISATDLLKRRNRQQGLMRAQQAHHHSLNHRIKEHERARSTQPWASPSIPDHTK